MLIKIFLILSVATFLNASEETLFEVESETPEFELSNEEFDLLVEEQEAMEAKDNLEEFVVEEELVAQARGKAHCQKNFYMQNKHAINCAAVAEFIPSRGLHKLAELGICKGLFTFLILGANHS